MSWNFAQGWRALFCHRWLQSSLRQQLGHDAAHGVQLPKCASLGAAFVWALPSHAAQQILLQGLRWVTQLTEQFILKRIKILIHIKSLLPLVSARSIAVRFLKHKPKQKLNIEFSSSGMGKNYNSSKPRKLATCLITWIFWNEEIISRVYINMQIRKVRSHPVLGLMLYFGTLFLQIIQSNIWGFFLFFLESEYY